MLGALEDGITYLTSQSGASLMALFWFTILFEIPRYTLSFLAAAIAAARAGRDRPRAPPSDQVHRMSSAWSAVTTARKPSTLAARWHQRIGQVFAAATLTVPDDPFQASGGRLGRHTEHLGHLLAEMQYMQRAYAGLQW